MGSRRNTRPRKKTKALAGVIRAQVDELRQLALALNGETFGNASRPDPHPAAGFEDDAELIVEATLGARYPDVPDGAAKRFNALAAAAPFYYFAAPLSAVHRAPEPGEPSEHYYSSGFIAPDVHSFNMWLRTGAGPGSWVLPLARFLVSPHRDRLRRCPRPECRKWFVDVTRNKSARRCSRPCTIAWSNAHRKEAR